MPYIEYISASGITRPVRVVTGDEVVYRSIIDAINATHDFLAENDTKSGEPRWKTNYTGRGVPVRPCSYYCSGQISEQQRLEDLTTVTEDRGSLPAIGFVALIQCK